MENPVPVSTESFRMLSILIFLSTCFTVFSLISKNRSLFEPEMIEVLSMMLSRMLVLSFSADFIMYLDMSTVKREPVSVVMENTAGYCDIRSISSSLPVIITNLAPLSLNTHGLFLDDRNCE